MWLSNFVTILNGRFRELIIPLIVLGLTNSPLIRGLVALSQRLGTVLFAIPIGTWVENKDKIKLSGICHLLFALGLAFLAFSISINIFNEYMIALILFLLGILSIILRTSFNVLIPKVSGRDKLLEAHTSVEGADAISTLIGPALAGLVLAQFGESITLGICAILSVISMIFVFRVYVDQPESNHNTSEKPNQKLSDFMKRSKEGVKYLISNSSQIVCAVAICSLGFSTVFIVLSVIMHAKITLNFSETLIGVLLSFAGLGNIIGVLIMNKFKNVNWLFFLSILMIISGLGVLLLLTNHLILMCLGMVLFDGALSMAFVVQGAVHQGVTPDAFLARVKSATYVISGIFTMIGTFLAGFIPEFFSTSLSLIIGIIVLVLPAIILIQFKYIGTNFNDIKPIYVE